MCIRVRSGGRIIIASDGLWDIATGKQAAKICRTEPLAALRGNMELTPAQLRPSHKAPKNSGQATS